MAFAGTPDFAVPSLQSVVKKHDVVAIICQPDKAFGRGRKMRFCEVKEASSKYHIPIYQPHYIEELLPTLKALSLDLMVVVAYGQLLSKAVLQLPRLGCVNVHASLLPRWRGAAPIARAIEAGDKNTGISIMQMAEGLDNGDILCQQSISIEQHNACQLSHNLATLGTELLLKTLDNIKVLQANATVQDDSLVCYAKKLNKEQANIDWQLSAVQIINKIRAFNPTPICYTNILGQDLRIYDATIASDDTLPKEAEIAKVIMQKKRFFIRCSDGWIAPLLVQPSNKKKMPVADFLNGFKQS